MRSAIVHMHVRNDTVLPIANRAEIHPMARFYLDHAGLLPSRKA